MANLFVSHSSEDDEAASLLAEWLERRGYAAYFLDKHRTQGIPGGRDWERELYLQIRANDAVIALLSEHYLQSPWCLIEIAQARALNKIVITLKLGDGEAGDAEAGSVDARVAETMSRFLGTSQMIRFADSDVERYERLNVALGKAGLDPANSLAWDELRSPWPGLFSYDREDAAVFFGREEETREVLDALERGRQKGTPRLLLITGSSGSGKSSLIRAGVVPRVDRRHWEVLGPMRPKDAPLAYLADCCFAGSDEQVDRAAFLRSTVEDPAAGADILQGAVKRIASRRNGDGSVLLVVDQLEESLVAMDERTNDERRAFHQVLRRLVEAPGLPLVVLATLRSDVIEDFEKHEAWIDLPRVLQQGRRIIPMPPDQFSRVVEGPAVRGRVTFEPGLSAHIVQDAKNENALPLLAFALKRLYDHRTPEGVLTHDVYKNVVKGIRGAIETAANDAVGGELTTEAEKHLRRAFVGGLVGVGKNGRYLRQGVRFDELPAEARPLLERFVDARLLTTNTERNVRIVEVVHEKLLEAWSTLDGWLKESHELLQFLDLIEDDARRWRAASKREKPSHLLHGDRLEKARQFLENQSDEIPDDICRFIRESVDVERRRAWTSRLILSAVGVLFAAVFVVAALAYLVDENRRSEAASHRQTRLGKTRLLQDASLDRDRRGDYGPGAVLLGHALVEAEGQDPDLEGGLRTAITLSRGRLLPLQAVVATGRPLRGCAIDPGGKYALIGTDDLPSLPGSQAGVFFVHPQSGRPLSLNGFPNGCYETGPAGLPDHVRSDDDNVTDVAISPDGSRFAVSANGGAIHLVDVRTGDARVIRHAGRCASDSVPTGLRFSSPPGASATTPFLWRFTTWSRSTSREFFRSTTTSTRRSSTPPVDGSRQGAGTLRIRG